MSVLVSSDVARPENLHEVTRLRLIDVVEISTEPQLVKKTRGARAICVPAAPDAFPIALISNDKAFQGGVIQTKVAAPTQGLDGSNENKIGCA
jgi:hypothetical protein